MIRNLLTAGLCVVLIGGVAHAEQSPETVKCAKAIETASAKFTKAVYKNVRKCILGIEKCDGDQVCNDRLLEILPEGRGKCAKSTLDEGVEYWGEDRSTLAVEANVSQVGKAQYKFVTKLGDKCMVPGVVFEGADGIPGFTFTPADVFELGDYLNQDSTTGAACSGLVQVVAEFPTFNALIFGAFENSSNLTNIAVSLVELTETGSTCWQ